MVMIGIVTGLCCPTSLERAHGVPPLTPFALAANVDCVPGVVTTADAARVATMDTIIVTCEFLIIINMTFAYYIKRNTKKI
jgi:hypothetical protein